MDLRLLLETTVVGLGFEVVDIEMSPRAKLLRVLIDSDRAGGVNVEDCAKVSNQLTRVLMVEEIDYDRLEVSSPGMDRPLTKPEHFQRFIGHQAQIRVRIPVAGRRNFAGTLKQVVDGRVCLLVEKNEVEIEFASIEKARLIPEFD
ncbi:MAG TPA: ribosome maturation factor RimP [Rhodocyclaceae bacterium]